MRASPYLLASFGLLLAVLPGCATIFDGTSKEVLFTSEPPGAQVIVRDQVIGTTPFSHKLNKRVREATFVRDIDEERKVPVKATFGFGWFLMNLLFTPGFGLSGIITDAATGAWMSPQPVVHCDFTTPPIEETQPVHAGRPEL